MSFKAPQLNRQYSDLSQTTNASFFARRTTVPSVQMQESPIEAETVAPPLSNARFSGIQPLQRIASGQEAALGRRHNGRPVEAVQTALVDLGYSLPWYNADGRYGSETQHAIEQFRQDQNLGLGLMDDIALHALDVRAPAAGIREQHFVDYDRLLEDSRLDITLAIGYDESEITAESGGREHRHESLIRETRVWLTGLGFELDASAGAGALERYSKQHNILNPTTNQTKEVEVIVNLIVPGAGARRAFLQAMNDGEILYYAGHARGGLGPDFDDKHDATEQVVLGRNSALHSDPNSGVREPRDQYHRKVKSDTTNDLETVRAQWQTERYRVWFFNACSSMNYLDEVRNGLLPDQMDRANLDILGTRRPSWPTTALDMMRIYIEGILATQTIEQMLQLMNDRHTQDLLSRNGTVERREYQTYLQDGAAGNQIARPPEGVTTVEP